MFRPDKQEPQIQQPFRPSPHSLALRRGIEVCIGRAGAVPQMKLIPGGNQRIEAILDNQAEIMRTLAHLCDAVLEMQGEPRHLRFERVPANGGESRPSPLVRP